MTIKFLEIRDRGTTVPAMAFDLSEQDGPIARRAGFGESPCYVLVSLAKMACEYDPFSWGPEYGRTMAIAHGWIEEHWSELRSGSVVDVEFILGERATPKVAECV